MVELLAALVIGTLMCIIGMLCESLDVVGGAFMALVQLDTSKPRGFPWRRLWLVAGVAVIIVGLTRFISLHVGFSWK